MEMNRFLHGYIIGTTSLAVVLALTLGGHALWTAEKPESRYDSVSVTGSDLIISTVVDPDYLPFQNDFVTLANIDIQVDVQGRVICSPGTGTTE